MIISNTIWRHSAEHSKGTNVVSYLGQHTVNQGPIKTTTTLSRALLWYFDFYDCISYAMTYCISLCLIWVIRFRGIKQFGHVMEFRCLISMSADPITCFIGYGWTCDEPKQIWFNQILIFYFKYLHHIISCWSNHGYYAPVNVKYWPQLNFISMLYHLYHISEIKMTRLYFHRFGKHTKIYPDLEPEIKERCNFNNYSVHVLSQYCMCSGEIVRRWACWSTHGAR